MRYLFIGLLSGMAICTQAQPGEGQRGGMTGGPGMQRNANPLLNQDFWQNKPSLEAIKAEVAKGANPLEMNAMSMDPIVMAINGGESTDVVTYLLEQQGSDVNRLTHDSRTYLFWAASKGNTELMQYLISKGAKVTMQDSHGTTPLTFAATTSQQNTGVYDLLVQNGANLKTDVTNDGANVLLLAVGNDPELKLTDYFVSKGLDIKSKDAAGNTAFDYAARSGNIDVMKKLLAKGVSFTNNAMLMAAQGSRRGGAPLPVFQYLESIGIKPTITSATGENVLHSLVRRPGQAAIIQYFISKGVNVNAMNEEGNTVFMNAATSNRDTATIALLAPLVKDINQKNKSGASALALAVRGNSPEVVQLLLNKGANINTVDAKGNNLVYYLFESYSPRQAREFEPKLKLLQAKGLDFAAPQKDGNTVYHLAVAKNDLALLKMVKDFGADINAKNSEGLTALHKAAMLSKDDGMMQYLLAAGAKKDIKTSFDETAYDLAHENELLTKQKVSVNFLKL